MSLDDRYWGHHSPLWTRVLRQLESHPFAQCDWVAAYVEVAGLPPTTAVRVDRRRERVLEELRRYVRAGVVERKRQLQRRPYRVIRIPEADFD